MCLGYFSLGWGWSICAGAVVVLSGPVVNYGYYIPSPILIQWRSVNICNGCVVVSDQNLLLRTMQTLQRRQNCFHHPQRNQDYCSRQHWNSQMSSILRQNLVHLPSSRDLPQNLLDVQILHIINRDGQHQ